MDETSPEGEEQEEKKWESIKVKVETREKLKGMGVGIGKAVEMLVEAKEQAVTEKIGKISEISTEIADILFESGLFDIKFEGAGIESADIVDKRIIIRGFIRVGIDDDDARERIFEVIKDGLEGESS